MIVEHCAICGNGYTLNEWDNRHDNSDADTPEHYHDYCCPCRTVREADRLAYTKER